MPRGRPADGAQQLSVQLDAAVRAGHSPPDARVRLSLPLEDALHEVDLRADVGNGLDDQREKFEGVVLVAVGQFDEAPVLERVQKAFS